MEWLPNIPTDPPCKVLQTPWPTGETDEGDGKVDETKNEMLYKIGFYFSPEEHVKLALRLQHPSSQFELVPDGLRCNIFLFTLKVCMR